MEQIVIDNVQIFKIRREVKTTLSFGKLITIELRLLWSRGDNSDK